MDKQEATKELYDENPYMPERTDISEKEEFEDKVNHPGHYTAGNIETFDYIIDKLTYEEFKGYIKGNILKYISRERHKNGVEDLKKAEWYLDKLIKRMEGK